MSATCGCQALKGPQMCQMARQIYIRWQPKEKKTDSPLKALLYTSLNDSHLPKTSLDIRGKQHKSTRGTAEAHSKTFSYSVEATYKTRRSKFNQINHPNVKYHHLLPLVLL